LTDTLQHNAGKEEGVMVTRRFVVVVFLATTSIFLAYVALAQDECGELSIGTLCVVKPGGQPGFADGRVLANFAKFIAAKGKSSDLVKRRLESLIAAQEVILLSEGTKVVVVDKVGPIVEVRLAGGAPGSCWMAQPGLICDE
jgi:hypothetical protein